jgi:uroporphyrin-III C-methyltransferase
MDKLTQRQQEVIRLTASDGPLPLIDLQGLPRFEPGWAWLVGAGPGDPGLLTLHAVNALKQADVIVYDALVSEDILSLASDRAEKIYAGKRGGKPSWKQSDICDELIRLAKANKRVLRLKGGDPFVFGRGGEEAEALIEASIPIRLIPGISAGIGGLGYAGIPVTHRDVNHAVTFVTGHLAGDRDAEKMDWQAISKGSPVLVIYMAMKKLPEIIRELRAAGRSADEPVAVVTHATTPKQAILVSSLETVVDDVEARKMEPPSIIVIGKVVNLHEKLGWFPSHQPI